jgi:hypothetical protein
MVSAQVKDTIPVKTGLFSRIHLPKLHLPKVNLFKKDTAIVKVPTVLSPKVKDTIVVISVDTPKKTNWLSKLGFTKKNAVKTDSAQVVAKVTNKQEVSVVEKPFELIQKDTATRKPFFAKLNFSKINIFKKDTTIAKAKEVLSPKVKDTIATIAKDTTQKKSWLSKIGFTKKDAVKTDSAQVVAKVFDKNKIKLISDQMTNPAQDTLIDLKTIGINPVEKRLVEKPIVIKVKDTVATIAKDTTKKTSWLSRIVFSKKNIVKTDSAVTVSKSNEALNEKVKDTSSLYKSMEKKFLKYTATTTISLLAGANFSKQTVDAAGYQSNFNYAFNDINEDVYKTGYFGGIRLDGRIQKKHEYALSFSLSKITTGANYISTSSLKPVVGGFSPFKAEDHFFVMNLAAHYKKLIPYGDLKKFKFYFVAGPSFDARLSKASIDNQVTNAYKQIFIKGDLGLEFNNRSLYTLFLHYHHNIGSLTKSPITTNINSFQLGIMVTATDLL